MNDRTDVAEMAKPTDDDETPSGERQENSDNSNKQKVKKKVTLNG